MDRVLAERGIGLVDGIALDIGGQLDAARPGRARLLVPGRRPARHADEPSRALTAAEFLNEADEAEIARILKDYGEEPRARAIARAIVAARPIERTAELAAIVRRAAGFRPGRRAIPRPAPSRRSASI